jgi:hypothetical protein
MGEQQGVMQSPVLSNQCFCNTQGHLLIYHSPIGLGGQSNLSSNTFLNIQK